ncbi:MAG TPA: ankyrin repeat domain-containing protein [Vicinamibacterales bacterium]|nr:ankyrin repeat domain-containing protein [Vicinamibacterales bacterium]
MADRFHVDGGADLVRSARAGLASLRSGAGLKTRPDAGIPLKIRPYAFVALAVILMTTAAITGDGVRLIEAVRAGDHEAVRALIRAKADVNAAEANGTTALQLASEADDIPMVKLLLAAGAKVDAANRYGVTPLSQAALNGSATMIETLLAAGADANAQVSRGQTVLMTAARSGHAAAVRMLLDHGAMVDAQEAQLGETALMWAAAENHADVVSLLLKANADPNRRSTSIKFPKDNFGLEGVPTYLPKGNWTALMYAAREGATEAARTLAEAGADLDAVDPDGTTALVHAITNSHYDTAAALIELGANPNLADSTGMAALYAATDMSSLGEVYGRPLRRVDDMHTAVDIIRLLLEHGADANATLAKPLLTRAHTPGDPLLGNGTTPLMRAAKNGDYRAMAVLLAHGADVSAKVKNNSTVLMFACGLGRGTSAFAEDVGTEADLLQAATLAIDHGADVQAVSDSGATALHYAAQSGLNSVVRLLAAHGAVLDAKDKQNRTPVDVARGVGGRGRAGGPPLVHPDTAALIEQLLGK